MEGGSLFNPGFLGGNFLWWVGQIADDSTWKGNINDKKHKSPQDIPGWGYRYKVRIIGLHDREEGNISSEQLPWAQVMYPITAGGGQGGSMQSPGLKQGNFVFGFFLDGQDEQVPVIMGVLGANAQIAKALTTGITGGENFTSQSGLANSSSDPSKIACDGQLATERPSGTSASGAPTGGDNPANPPTPNAAPTKENTAPHQETAEDKRKDKVLKRKHALFCADPTQNSPMKGIQTIIEEVTKKIEEYQSALESYAAAVSSGISVANDLINQVNQIAALFKDAACEIAKFLLALFNMVRDFVTDLFTKVLQPVFKIAPPTIRIELLDKLMKALEILACIFNKIGLSLCGSAERSLRNSFKRRSVQSQPPASVQPYLTDEFKDIPWLARGAVVSGGGVRDYYNPSPMCYTEELVAEILAENLNDIIQGFDSALLPIVRDVQNTLEGISYGEGTSVAGTPATVASSSGSPLLPNIPNIPSIPGLGALGGAGFDIGAALGFISAIMGIFSCDILPKCSPNDTHTLQEGAKGKSEAGDENEPSLGNVAKQAIQSLEKSAAANPTAQATAASFESKFKVPRKTMQPGEGGAA